MRERERESSADEACELEFELFNGNIDLLRLGKLEQFYRNKASEGEWSEKECELQIHRIHDIARRFVSRSREGIRLIITASTLGRNFANGRKIIRFKSRDEFIHSADGLSLALFMLREPEVTSLYMDSTVYKEAPKEAHFLEIEAARLGKFFISYSAELPPYVLSQQAVSEGRLFSVPRLSKTPNEISIFTGVSNCNIACRFCPQTFDDVPFRMMDFSVFRKAVDAVPQNIPIKVSMTPYTEPLLLRSFLPMIEYAVMKRPVANIGFNTNGVLMNRKRIEKIVDIRLKYIIISLNMPDRESYKWFTGKDFFDRVTENIRLLHARKYERNSMYPKVIVQFLHHPKLKNVLDEAVQYWEQFSDEVWIREISVPGNTAEARERLLESMGNNPFEEHIPALYPCPSPFVSTVIDVNGYYLPCCSIGTARSIAQEGESPYEEMVLGHVNEMTVVEAWNSEKMQKIRALQMTGLLDACRGCLSRECREGDFFGLKEALMQSCYRV